MILKEEHSKHVLVIGYWNLGLICYLVLGIWDFMIGGEGRGFRNQSKARGKESKLDPVLIKLAVGGLAVLGCIGLLFGIGLALAAHKFAVEINPKIEEVKEILAGAQ